LTSTDPEFILGNISKYHEERREGTGPVTVRQPASQGAKASPKGTMRPGMENVIGPPLLGGFLFQGKVTSLSRWTLITEPGQSTHGGSALGIMEMFP